MKRFIAAAGLIIFSAPVWAVMPHETIGANHFAGHVGFALPLGGDLHDVAETGFQIGGDWIHNTRADLGFGAGIDFASYGSKTTDGIKTDVDQFSILGLARKELASAGSSSPYLIGGLGITQTNIDYSFDAPVFVRNSGNEDDTSPTILVGTGVDFPIGNGLLAGMSARYQYVFFDIGNVSGGGTLQLLGQLRW